MYVCICAMHMYVCSPIATFSYLNCIYFYSQTQSMTFRKHDDAFGLFHNARIEIEKPFHLNQM